jgi:hypothetical protein
MKQRVIDAMIQQERIIERQDMTDKDLPEKKDKARIIRDTLMIVSKALHGHTEELDAMYIK